MKKLWLIVMCGLLALGLAACGDEQKQTEQVWLQTKQVTCVAGGESVFVLEREYDEAGRVVAKREAYDGEYDDRTEYTYDELGNLTHTVQYHNGHLWLTTDIVYTAAGDKLEYREYRADDEGSEPVLAEWWQYEYDGAGRQLRWLKLDADGRVYHTAEYEHNEAGELLRNVEYENGELWRTEEWERDEAGREVAFAAHWADGELDWARSYVWDDAGNKVEEKQQIGDAMVLWSRYTYDEDGRLLVKNYCDEYGRITERLVEYEYDQAGRRLARRDYLDDERQYWQLDTYDEQGRLVNRCEGQYDMPYDNNTGYVYDEFGNVIRCTSFGESHEPGMYAEFEYVQMELPLEQADWARKEQQEWWAGI